MATVSSDWSVWGLTARVVVRGGTDGDTAAAARTIVQSHVDDVDRAASRFRADSEVRLWPDDGLPHPASATLGFLIDGALAAARLTDGDVDPTLAPAMDAIGYDADIAQIQLTSGGTDVVPRIDRLPSGGGAWLSIRRTEGQLTLPRSTRLDLGATAKAITADRAASDVAEQLGCDVLVELGGDISTAGLGDEGWEVLVQDLPSEPAQQVHLAARSGLATSSTLRRRWMRGGRPMHHILDPRSALPVEPTWRTVSVAAHDCLTANAYSTAAIVRGTRAETWLSELGVSARLIGERGRVVTTGFWPEDVALSGQVAHG